MSKMLEATCVSGVVTAGGVPVPAADILSEGVGSSEGILLLDQDQAKYLAKTSPDLKTTLDKLVTILGQLTSALTSIDNKVLIYAAGPGTTAPTPTATSNIAAITTIQTELSALKESLK
jgi:hypothetical protein